MIVKVQLPLNHTGPLDHLALIYPAGRDWMLQRPLTDAEMAMMGGAVKAYFYAVRSPTGEVTLLGRMDDQPW